MFPDGEPALAQAEGRFPVVIKPAYKACANRLTVDKAWRADGPDALRRLYREACSLVDPRILMIQELVAGNGDSQLSYAALCSNGEVVASLAACRLRQYPMDFGRASSYVETIDDPNLEDDATRLLAALRFSGMVEVEFKRDPATGANLLLDINPRAWGWQSLGGRAGVDFPYLLWRLASGDRIPRTRAVAGRALGAREHRRPRGARRGRCRPALGARLRALPAQAARVRRLRAATIRCRHWSGPLLTARLVARRVAAGKPV